MWRLVNGSSEYDGTLEFKFIDGEWGHVCGANMNRATVERICNELGYRTVVSWDLFTIVSNVNGGNVFALGDLTSCTGDNIVSLHCSPGM